MGTIHVYKVYNLKVGLTASLAVSLIGFKPVSTSCCWSSLARIYPWCLKWNNILLLQTLRVFSDVGIKDSLTKHGKQEMRGLCRNGLAEREKNGAVC